MPTFQERAIVANMFEKYGIHPRCKKCLNLKECPSPQYNAEGMTLFYCNNFKENKTHHDKN